MFVFTKHGSSYRSMVLPSIHHLFLLLLFSFFPTVIHTVDTPNNNLSFTPVTFSGGGWVTSMEVHDITGYLYARTDVGGIYRSVDGGNSWYWLTNNLLLNDAWSTQAITINQTDSTGNTVYAGIGFDGSLVAGSGIWKTTDGGNTWKQILSNVSFTGNGNQRLGSSAIIIDAYDTNILWAAPQHGLLVSFDSGNTWSNQTSFFTAGFYNNSASSSKYGFTSIVTTPPQPTDPSFLSHIFIGGIGFGLAFSADKGQSWEQIPVPSIYNSSSTDFFTVCWRILRLNNGTVWGSCEYGPNKNQRSIFFISVNTPNDWNNPSLWRWTDVTPSEGPLEGNYQLLDTLDNDTVLVIASSYMNTFAVSRNSGGNWSTKNTTVISNKPGWWTNFNNNWVPFGRNKVLKSKLQPDRWILASGFGVLITYDEGDTWSWSSTGIGEVCMYECQRHPTLINYTFCGAMDLSGFIITDIGTQYGVNNEGAYYSSIFNHESEYWNVDYARGVAWMDLTNDNPNVGLLTAGNAQLYGSIGQLIRWTNPWLSNVTFTNSSVMDGIDTFTEFTGLFQSLSNVSDILLLTGWGGLDSRKEEIEKELADEIQEYRYYQSLYKNYGVRIGSLAYLAQRMERKLQRFTKDIYRTALSSSSPPSLLPLSPASAQYGGFGLLRSTDFGQTWHQVGINNPTSGFAGTMWTDFRAIVNDAGNKQVRWWSLTGNGVFISYDNGETWNATPAQPVDTGEYSQVQLSPDTTPSTGGSGCMYAATVSSNQEGASLKHTCDYGTTWNKIGNFYLGMYPNDPFPRIDVYPTGNIALLAYGQNYTYPTVWVSTDNGITWLCATDASTGYNVGWGVTGLCWHNSSTLLISTAGHSIIAVHV